MSDPSAIRIEIKGLDKLLAKLDQFPKEIARTMSQAGHEAANRVILPTVGLQKYPGSGAGNQPPTPYYVRTRGMQYAKGNDGRSENLGKQWYVKREGWQTFIGNRASYARWVHGDETQARHIGKLGWRKLFEVAKDKVGDIQKVYQAWVDKTLRDLGL